MVVVWCTGNEIIGWQSDKKNTSRPTMDPSFFADGPPVAFNPEEYRTLSTLPIKPGTWSYQPYDMEHKLL